MRSKMLGSLIIAGCLGSAIVTANGPTLTYQTTNLFMFMNPTVFKPGGATLYRAKQAVEMRVAAGGLNMNSSYTVWWVVFNNPDACVGGCGSDDLARPDVRASVLYAAGFVTGLGDTGNVTAHLESGAVPEGVDVELGSGLEPGNGLSAEIHLVIRTHGATNVGHVDQQIGSFNGGCNPTCANVQAARFPPVGR